MCGELLILPESAIRHTQESVHQDNRPKVPDIALYHEIKAPDRVDVASVNRCGGSYVVFAFFCCSDHLALADRESFLFVAALIARRGLGIAVAFLRSAHIFFAASEIRLRPAALIRRRACGCFVAGWAAVDVGRARRAVVVVRAPVPSSASSAVMARSMRLRSARSSASIRSISIQ